MKTRAFVKRAGARGQGGSAVVELALTLGLMLGLLAAPFVIARALLQVNVTQRAVGNATRMAAMHPLFLRTRSDVNFSAKAKETVASALASAGVVEPGGDIGELEIDCEVPRSLNCKGTGVTPEQITGGVAMEIPSPIGDRAWATFLVFDRYAHGGPQPW